MEKIVLAFVGVVVVLATLCNGQEPSCGAHEVFDACGSACPEYCHKDANEPCTKQCVLGCRCADGYVKRTFDSNVCVPKGHCKSVRKCGARKTFYSCGTACPEYCGSDPNQICTRQCVAECQCEPGYVLASEKSSHCILRSECPTSTE